MQQLLRIALSPRLTQILFAFTALFVGYLALTPTPPRVADLGWDKLNHLSAFCTLMLLAGLGWPRRQRRAAVGLLGYGGLIEVLQTQVPGRSAEWVDLLADALGLLLAVALRLAASRLRARRQGISARQTR